MRTVLFSVSSEAAAWIVDMLKKSAQRLEKKGIKSAYLMPVLSFVYGYQKLDNEYHLLERYDAAHFDLGWNYAEEMDPGGFRQVEITESRILNAGLSSGFKILVHHSTLKELEGNELVLEEIEVGYPIPSSKKCQLLKARPKGGEDSKAVENNPPIS